MKFRTQPLNLIALVFLLLTFAQVNAQQPKRKKVARKVSQPAPQVRFISGRSALNMPFELSGNLILMQARVNDSRASWFIFDTGADSTVIDAQLAKDLKLKPGGKIVGAGSAGTAEAIIFKGISLRFPNMEAEQLTVGALPLDFLSASFGRKIGGVIGNDIIKEFVVEVDYASQTMNFYEPQSYRYSGGGEIIPLIIEENLPFVRAGIALDGRTRIEGKFELDTGSTGSILLNAPFVKKHQLIKGISKTKQINVGGVGGTGRALLGRIKNVTIGRFALENPVARFYQGTRGDNASAKYDGLIGGEIFRRFKVIFDYPHRQMTLEPNALMSESFEIDMSGLELVADGDDFSLVLIDDVEVDSPAAKAGIEGGDIITAIDGRSTVEVTLDQIRKLFMQEGREYQLSLKRGAKVIQTKLKLRKSI
jgi:hypothetical protein